MSKKTLGESRVDYDSTADPKVKSYKIRFAGIIDDLEKDRLDENKNFIKNEEKQRAITKAQDMIELASMLTVKSIFK